MRLAIIFLFFASTSVAQSSPSIKGHTLGESISTFAPGIGSPTYLASCTAKLATPAPSAQPAKKRGIKEIMREYDLQDDAKERAQCEQFVHATNFGTRIEVPVVLWGGKAIFDKAVLVKITVNVAEESLANTLRTIRDQVVPPSYEQVVGDMSKKFGQPTLQDDVPTQNGYGAVFHHRVAQWDRRDLYAEVFEVDAGGVRPDGRIDSSIINVTIETAEERRADLVRKQSQPSSVD